MKKYVFLLLITGAILFITSCQEAANGNTTGNKGDTTPTTNNFDVAKAKAWIEADNAKFVEEAKKGDSNALAAHYASDAWLMFDNMEPFKGTTAITSGWGGAVKMGVKDVKITTVDVVGNADLLVETGMYELYGAGNKLMDKGKYVVVWKPENGGWKIYRDIGNSNMPMKK